MTAARTSGSPRPLFINRLEQVIRSRSRQHRKRPESPRPLAVALLKNRRFLGSEKSSISRDATYPRLSAPPAADRGRRSDSVTPRPAAPFQSARTAQLSNRPAPQPQFLSPPQPRPGRAGSAAPRRAPASLARVTRARHRNRTARRTAGERRRPPNRREQRPGHHSRAGLKGAAAERDALRR